MIPAQTPSGVCREGKPLRTFPDHALALKRFVRSAPRADNKRVVACRQRPAVVAKPVGDGITPIAPEIAAGDLDAGRGLPALVYRSLATRTETLAAALLQATSLSILIVAGQIGVQLDLLRPAVYAALVAAGLLSVLLFPVTALTLLRSEEARSPG